MEKLKVGDTVYCVNESYDSKNKYYRIEKVERITNTLAILSYGTKLKNIKIKDFLAKECYRQIPLDTYKKWYILTDEVCEEIKKETERQRINNWVRYLKNKSLSDQENKIIYEALKDLITIN